MDSRSAENLSHIPSIITAVVVVAALYFSREVLVPIVVAILLTVLLSPIASKLERHHFGKTAAALTVWLVAVITIVFVGWLVVNQGIHLATRLPNYSQTISRKIGAISGAKNSAIGRAIGSLQQIGSEFSSAIQSAESTPAASQQEGKLGAPSRQQNRPVPVQIVGQGNFNFGSFTAALKPVIFPTLETVIVFVVTAFMLLRRKNIRDRLFTLAGLSRIHVTRQVFTDATDRTLRYLWMLSSVNFTFGTLFGVALYFLGLPDSLLWGVLAALLRFVPYIGSAIGAVMPVILSVAIFEGWRKPLIILGVYLFLEGILAYGIEPVLYSRRTGISALAVLVAAIFWAALWGPIGLLLSTPLTVSIVAIGRYIPELEFLSILFGTADSVATDIQLYQTLSAGRSEESQHLVNEFLKEKSLLELYESVLLPLLVLAEKDRSRGYQAQRRNVLFRELKGVVDDLRVSYPLKPSAPSAPAEIRTDEQILPYRHPGTPSLGISCIPVRDEGDEIVCTMLSHLLKLAGYKAREIALGTNEEMVEEISEHGGSVIYISALPPFAISALRRLYKRVRAQFAESHVAVCLWQFAGALDSMKALLDIGDSDLIITNIGEAVVQIQQFVEAPESHSQASKG